MRALISAFEVYKVRSGRAKTVVERLNSSLKDSEPEKMMDSIFAFYFIWILSWLDDLAFSLLNPLFVVLEIFQHFQSHT